MTASGWAFGRTAALHRGSFTRRDVWEKKSWPWRLYIKPVVLAISHHCLHTSIDSHTPPPHTPVRVRLGFCVTMVLFSGSWGRPVWKCVRSLFIDWTVVVSAVCEISPVSPKKSFWVNHRAALRVCISLSCSSTFILDVRTAKVLGPNICKNILWYKQSWEGRRWGSGFLSFPVSVCHEKLI